MGKVDDDDEKEEIVAELAASNLSKNLIAKAAEAGMLSDDDHKAEAEDAIGSIKETQQFVPQQSKEQTPGTPASMGSSYRSDGEPVFGARWSALDLNPTDGEEEDEVVTIEENKEDKVSPIDTSQTEYANIVVIGNANS